EGIADEYSHGRGRRHAPGEGIPAGKAARANRELVIQREDLVSRHEGVRNAGGKSRQRVTVERQQTGCVRARRRERIRSAIRSVEVECLGSSAVAQSVLGDRRKLIVA